MEKIKEILCTLIIPRKIYMELAEEVKELFVKNAGSYSTEFPAGAEDNTFLGEYIQAFSEVVLIINNPKYGITEDCQVSTELLTLGHTEESFSLLVTIEYPGSDKSHHDIFVFREVSQQLGHYTFELLGDQTYFSVE